VGLAGRAEKGAHVAPFIFGADSSIFSTGRLVFEFLEASSR